MACCLAIIWTNAWILLIRHSATNFSRILIKIHAFPFKKMHLKMSGKWWPLCFGLNMFLELILSSCVAATLHVRWVKRMDGDVEGVRHCVIERKVLCNAGISIIVLSYLVIYQRLINSLTPGGQSLEASVIWDAITPMWRHCYVCTVFTRRNTPVHLLSVWTRLMCKHSNRRPVSSPYVHLLCN